MKKCYLLLLICFGLIQSYAQDNHEMIIEPVEIGILDQTILGDTTPTGERVDPDRVYVLRRGSPYLINQIINVEGYHLRLKAEEGDGSRPLLIFNAGSAGVVEQMFVTGNGGQITLEGLHLSGQDILGRKTLRLIRLNGLASKVTVDNCYLDESGQSGFRLNADSIKVFISNSLVNRMGQLNDPNNGRFLDNRGHPIDSLVVENCVIYDVTSRVYRHGGSAANLNYALFNQNTIFGSGQFCFTFSPAKDLTFTNNIVANAVFLGFTGDQRHAITLEELRDGDNVNVSFNNFFNSPDFDAALPQTSKNSGDTIKSITGAWFSPLISDIIANSASATTNIHEVLEFTNAPGIQQDFIDVTYDSTATLGTDWDFSDLTPDEFYSQIGGTGINRYLVFHDFSYSENSQSYVAGDKGQKIGADLSNIDTRVREDFFVRDNILFYPNPAGRELFIQNLDESEFHSVEIYDIRGVPVTRERIRASTIRLDLPDVPAGTYILTIRDANGKVSSRQLIKN